jgi:hypothetical protein
LSLSIVLCRTGKHKGVPIFISQVGNNSTGK